MSKTDLAIWTVLLCTPVMEFALRHNGTQLHSGWFRLLKHHLQRTRLPRLTRTAWTRVAKLSELLTGDPNNAKAWEQMEELVAGAFSLTTEECQTIKSFLKDCHRRSIPNDLTQSGPARKAGTPRRIVRTFEPVTLGRYTGLHRERLDLRRAVTFQLNKQLSIHRWYPFTQGFSAPLVEALLNELKVMPGKKVLDPFAGCGTTLLACKAKGIASVGIEISPLLVWVAHAKLRRWHAGELSRLIDRVAVRKVPRVTPRSLLFQDYLSRAYSPHILDQLLGVARLASDKSFTAPEQDFLRLGLVGILEEVSQIRKHGSHYRYMLTSENVGVQKLNIPIISPHADIFPIFIHRLRQMLQDVRSFPMPRPTPPSEVRKGDARCTNLEGASIDFAITSPPYLNRNNYIAQQKAEMALLGFLSNYSSYRALVRSTLRSHVECEFGAEPKTQFDEVRKIVQGIDLSPDNNAKIPHMVAGYFEDLDAVLRELARVVVPGGLCAFVVGNSRWGGVVVPVDHLTLMIAERHGFEPQKVLVTRLKGNSPQQMRRYGRIPVRESVVIFRKA